jgi:putative SOS response-associated peptidase YedK
MCGRYTLRNSQAKKDEHLLNIDVSNNISPSHQVLTHTTEPTFMKWSYNPILAKTPMSLINARSETLNVKPSIKMVKRCLIILDGWFEWLRTDNSKQPYFFHMSDSLFSFAGIYTEYNGEKGCAIITKEATKQLSEVHNRMPVIIADDDFDSWLSGKYVFDSKLSENINYYRVSAIVNSPRNNDKTCMESLPPNS